MYCNILFRRLPVVFILAAALKLSAQGTAIFYQGRLNDAGVPANTNYDFRFAVYNAPTNGGSVSASLTNYAVPVASGLFTVTLDFGSGVFNGTVNGSNYWMDIGVRAIGVTNFTPLAPRQPILPVPYALFATSASNLLGALQSTQLVGTISSSLISGTYSNGVNFSNGTNYFNGVFSGNGTNLNNLNGSQITGGTIADARLTTNVALLNRSQTFTGSNTFTGTNYFNGVNTFTNWGNSFVGSFFGNGLVGWLPVYGSATNASRDTGYLLLNPSQTTVTLPATNSLLPGDIVRISGAGAGGWIVLENPGESILGNFASYRNSFLLPSSVGSDWRRLCCSADGTRMFAGGNSLVNAVYDSTDFGHTWLPTTSGGANWCSLACSASGSIVFAAPAGGANPIQVSYNGGLNFSNIANGSTNWSAIACSADGSKFLASAANGNLYLWSGNTLGYIVGSGPYPWSAVACSGDGNNLAAALANGNIAYSTNGSVWAWATAPGNVTALAAAASGQKLVAAWIGGISTSTNFGGSWTTTTAPAANWSCLAASSDCTRLVAGVSNGLFYASANFGATWTPLTTTNQFWSGACMSADGSKFAGAVATVGVPGGIYYSGTSAQPNTLTTNALTGSQGSAVELQYIGNGQFMPVSSAGLLWAN